MYQKFISFSVYVACFAVVLAEPPLMTFFSSRTWKHLFAPVGTGNFVNYQSGRLLWHNLTGSVSTQEARYPNQLLNNPILQFAQILHNLNSSQKEI